MEMKGEEKIGLYERMKKVKFGKEDEIMESVGIENDEDSRVGKY